MRSIDADSLKENGFVVPKTFKRGDVYLEVKAEDVATETAPVRRFFINDKIIDAIPTIEAEPKHAYVIVDEDGNMECSNCGSSNCFDNYCGHCGAKLIGERKDEVEE